MRQYNIDFFNLSMENVHHDTVAGIEIDDDYLSPSENTIEIAKTNKITNKSIIYIRDLDGFVGIVTEVSNKDYTTEVKFKPLIALFDHDVIIDIRWQKNKSSQMSIENVISTLITRYWIGSSARAQNLSSMLNTPTTSSSTLWTRGFKAEVKGGYRRTVGFYSDIIAKALTKYKVRVKPVIDFDEKKIDIVIGQITGVKMIETDLPNVEVETFSIDEPSSSVNTLEIWHEGITRARFRKDAPVITYYKHEDAEHHVTWTTDSDNKVDGDEKKATIRCTPTQAQSFETAADAAMNAYDKSSINTLDVRLDWGANGHLWHTIYYLHTNGTYSTSASSRVTPAVIQVSSIDIDDDESFNSTASDEADSVFDGLEWTSLVELTMDIDDGLVAPKAWKHGQLTDIYKDGAAYRLSLTGIKTSADTVTLVFGTVRHDLTKKLKRR